MNKAVPWSIKGVDFDAREAAKEAARRSGMTLGEWLNSVIADQAAESGVDVEEVDDTERLEAVASRLARMSRGGPRRIRDDYEEEMPRAPRRRPQMEARPRPAPVSAPAVIARDYDAEMLLDQAIQAFEKGSRHAAQRTTAALSRVVERLEEIEEKLEERAAPPAPAPIARGARAQLARVEEEFEAFEEPAVERSKARRFSGFGRSRAESELVAKSELLAKSEPVAKSAPPVQASAPMVRDDGVARLEARIGDLIDTLKAQQLAPQERPAPARAQAPQTPPPRPSHRLPIASRPQAAPVRATIADAVAQITRRQRELDGEPAAPPATPARAAEPSPDFGILQKDIAALSARLEDTRRDLIERDERRQSTSAERARLAAAADPGPEISMLRRQIEDLSRGFAQLASRENLTSLETAVRDLSQRVEASRQGGIGDSVLRPVEELAADIRHSLANLPTASVFQFIEAEIRSLRSRLDTMQGNALDPRAFQDLQAQTAEVRAVLSQALAQPVSLDSIERKIAGLTDRVDMLARHGGSPIDSAAVIQSIGDIRGTLDAALGNGVLAQLGARMDALVQRFEAAALAPPAVERLSERIDVLGRKIDDAVSQSGASDQLDRLTQSIETVRRSIDVRPDLTPSKFDTRALEKMMRDLAEKLERPPVGRADTSKLESIVSTIAEKLEEAPSADMRHIASLQKEISRLADQIERVAPAVDAQRLEDMVADLSGKLVGAGAPASDLRLAEALSAQIADLGARVDASQTLHDRTLADDLRAEMAHLAERIEAGQMQVNPRAIETIGEQIAMLSDRLQVSDQSARVLASLETAVSDLFSRIDDMRDATLGAAESAARVAAREAVREVLDVQPGSSGVSSEALTRELLDLRSIQDAADRRNHSTLTAVHETLEKIVDRLAVIEDDFSEVRPEPLPAKQPAAAPKTERLAAARVEAEAPAIAVRPPEPRSRVAAPSVDDLIEPGSGAPSSRRAPEAQAPAEAAEGSKQASFIAAARSAMTRTKSGKGDKAPAASRDAKAEASAPKVDALAEAREQARAAHLAALGDVASDESAKANDNLEGGTALGRVRSYINGHRRVVIAGLACIATILGTLQVIRIMRPQEPSSTLVEFSAPATPSPVVPQAEPVQPAPAAPEPQRQGALDASEPKVAGNFTQQPIDLNQAQRFARGDQPSDPTVTNSIGPAASAPRLTLTAAVAAGQPAAQYELATRYADGRGVSRDLQQARLLFEKAAQQNLAPAQFRLGAIFERGIGAERDLQKAHDFYLRAANQGNIRAMHNLAVLSAEGVDGKPDYATAASWFQKAAEYGVRDSQYNLAILMARGLGAEQNLKSSWMWFSLAAAQGDADAEKKRDEVGSRLNAKDLAAARAQYEAFRAKTPVTVANDVQAPAGGWDQASPVRTESKVEMPAPAAKAPPRGKVTSL